MRVARSAGRVGAMLITRREDVGYLSSFTGEDGFLLIGGPGRACLITDGRFGEQAAGECGDIEVCVRTEAASSVVAQILRTWRLRSLGVQADHMTIAVRDTVARAISPGKVKPVVSVVAGRVIKDTGEITAVTRAVRVAERALRSLLAGGARAWIAKTERRLAGELDYQMRLAGADEPAFETIVAAGDHSSLPHYRPGGRRIRRGQVVLIDWGAKVGGYCSDLTRVVFVGRIPPKLAEVYGIVLRSQAATIAAIRSGVAGRTVDAVSREVIVGGGYGKYLLHAVGHGIGREIHEAPVMGGRSPSWLRAGMIVTVEPGVYLPGVGGVRIEDDVLVTPDGARKLGSLPRAMGAMVLVELKGVSPPLHSRKR